MAQGWDLGQHRPALPITVASGHSHGTLGCCGVPPTPGVLRMRCGRTRGGPSLVELLVVRTEHGSRDLF